VNTRRITLITAIVLALGTGYLTITYLGSLQAQGASPKGARRVVIVAAVDIPARVRITAAMLSRGEHAVTEIDPDAIAEQRQAVGSLALISIPAGGLITLAKIGRPADVGLTVRLSRGQRAVSIGIDRVKGVSGLVQPGDRVDVIAIPPRAGSEPKAFTIIRGAIVMALGNQLESAGATPSPGAADVTTVTLAVTPAQADLLSMADLTTTLRLALRSPQEPIRSLPVEKLVFENVPLAASAPVEPLVSVPPPYLQPQFMPRPIAVTAPAQAPAVTIIDGDRIVSRSDGFAVR
jgi:pilus assembly protein CpaB